METSSNERHGPDTVNMVALALHPYIHTNVILIFFKSKRILQSWKKALCMSFVTLAVTVGFI